MSDPAIEVHEPGMLTSVQDPRGRIGWRRLGVPVSGAADPFAAMLANRLVGNVDDAALLEITLTGPVIRVLRPLVVAIAGAELPTTVAGRALPHVTAVRVRDGDELRFGAAQRGARAYLAVAGGLGVDRVLGSHSTDLRSGFGGFSGRALRVGDLLTVGSARPRLFRWTGGVERPGPIRVLRGPHGEGAFERLCAQAWAVSHSSDRSGVRLDGKPIVADDAEPRTELASMGLPLGAIQLPPDGLPIVMLPDRPVTGGYPVMAVVARADVGLLAQAAPGDTVRFTAIDVERARGALAARMRTLDRLEPIHDDEAAWAGALG